MRRGLKLQTLVRGGAACATNTGVRHCRLEGILTFTHGAAERRRLLRGSVEGVGIEKGG